MVLATLVNQVIQVIRVTAGKLDQEQMEPTALRAYPATRAIPGMTETQEYQATADIPAHQDLLGPVAREMVVPGNQDLAVTAGIPGIPAPMEQMGYRGTQEIPGTPAPPG